jgi:hypothetical protein
MGTPSHNNGTTTIRAHARGSQLGFGTLNQQKLDIIPTETFFLFGHPFRVPQKATATLNLNSVEPNDTSFFVMVMAPSFMAS